MKIGYQKNRVWCILFLIVITALLIRLYDFRTDEDLIASDEANFFLAGLDLFEVFEHGFSYESLEVVYRFLNFPRGPILPLIHSLNVAFLTLLGIPITETTSTLIYVLLGSLLSILVFSVAKLFFSKRVALLSGVFIAITPLFVTTSRELASLGMISLILLLLIIFFIVKFKVYVNAKKSIKFIFGLLLGLYFLSDVVSICLIPFLCLSAFHYAYIKNEGDVLKWLKRTSRSLLQKEIILGFLLLAWPIFFSWAYHSINTFDVSSTIFGHYLDRGYLLSPGLHIKVIVLGTVLSLGLPLTLIVLPIGLSSLVFIRPRSKKNILIFWFWSYIFPWLFLLNVGVPHRDYFLMWLCVLLIFGANLIECALSKIAYLFFSYDLFKKLLKSFIYTSLFLSTFMYTLVYVYEIPLFTMDDGFYYGNVHPNSGAKTAGYFIRKTTKPEDIIFSTLGQPISKYYFNRKIATEELKQNVAPDFIVVHANDSLIDHFLKDYYETAIILSKEMKKIMIFSKEPTNHPPSVLNVEVYDRLFDQEYGTWRSLKADCYYCFESS